MKNYFRLLPIIILGTIMFLSIGFSSFSSNLTIDDIKASVRPTKNIRITNFYAIQSSNSGSSSWEEFSSNRLVTSVTLPNQTSSVSYMVEVTNLDSEIMMIDSITGLPEGVTYRLVDYTLYDKLCNNGTDCTQGTKKRFQLILENETGHVLDQQQVIKLDINFSVYSYLIIFDANGGTGTMTPFNVKYDLQTNLPSCLFHRVGYKFTGWNTQANGSGTSYTNGQLIQNINNGMPQVTLYAQWEVAPDSIYYPGVCSFNGQGHAMDGSCAGDNDEDYINTGVAPFSQENFEKNFVLSLKINSVDDAAFSSNGRGTIFNMIYEGNDSIGKFPGVVLRIDNGKWLLQGSRGIDPDYANKINFQKQELLGKELKVIRYNDGETIKLYYTIDDNGPFLLKDITAMPHPFDTILTFGAGLDYDNVTAWRYAIADVSDISFEFWPDGSTLDDMSGIIHIPPDDEDMETVFYQQGTCEFHGTVTTITGSACTDYQNEYMINTGVQLFTTEGLTKDFDLSFNIVNYVSGNQEVNQTTLFNAFRERSGTTGYGMLLRKNSGNLQFIIRDGSGAKKELTLSATTTSSLRIIKKGDYVCYSINGAPMKYALSLENITAPFSVPVTFGGSIDINGDPFRYITGSLSEMKIDMGHFGSDVNCDPSMT